MGMFDEVRCEYRLPLAAAPERWAAGRGKARRSEAKVVTDPRHRALLDIVKNLPSDFAPWGERSREEEWGPD